MWKASKFWIHINVCVPINVFVCLFKIHQGAFLLQLNQSIICLSNLFSIINKIALEEQIVANTLSGFLSNAYQYLLNFLRNFKKFSKNIFGTWQTVKIALNCCCVLSKLWIVHFGTNHLKLNCFSHFSYKSLIWVKAKSIEPLDLTL